MKFALNPIHTILNTLRQVVRIFVVKKYAFDTVYATGVENGEEKTCGCGGECGCGGACSC